MAKRLAAAFGFAIAAIFIATGSAQALALIGLEVMSGAEQTEVVLKGDGIFKAYNLFESVQTRSVVLEIVGAELKVDKKSTKVGDKFLSTISLSEQIADGKNTKATFELVKPSRFKVSRGENLLVVAFSEAAAEEKKPIAPEAPPPQFTGVPISMDFHEAEIKNVLRMIAEVSGINIIAGDDVKGTVTTRMSKVPWDQALDVILKLKGLVKARDGNVLRILTVESLKREEEAKRAEEEAQAKARVAKAQALKAELEVVELEPLEDKLIPILYAKADEIKKNLDPFLSRDKTGKPRGFIDVNTHTNTLIIRDVRKNLEDIVKIVETLDRPTAQVLIEAKIVEATRNFVKDLGIQWGGGLASGDVVAAGGLGAAPTRGNLAVDLPAIGATGALQFSLGNIANTRVLDMRLSAMEKTGQGRILTSPKIATLDNREAVIQRGDRIPIRVLNQQGVTSTQFVDANLTLTVTPHVTSNQVVSMKISVALDEPDFGQTIEGVPKIVTRNARTEALVRNGETSVLGGLFSNTSAMDRDAVPGLSRIPIFGRIFKRDSSREESRELLIFITPYISTPPR